MAFSPAETEACQRLAALAITEDLGPVAGPAGDITSHRLLPADVAGSAGVVARAPGVLAGLPAVSIVARAIDSRLIFRPLIGDGQRLQKGDVVATLEGPMVSLLAAERTVLNFLQHLSGIATQTARYVQAVEGIRVVLLDTRKTLPGWRLLEKYAVRMGGGSNHRVGLFDQYLIKDNHLAAGRQVRMSLAEAVAKAKKTREHSGVLVEVEVESLDQLSEALSARPDIIMLDNMPPGLLRQAVEIRNQAGAKIPLEASGGVTLQTVRTIAETGVERISIGALTHSAPALDLALDWVR